ncbi:MAG: glycoside hydrolase family 32 protein, partial [Lachnospiraceae bacterium]|nr:glycoside hydrolase family 32 protein [Lachnospiraceae bacterium]
METNKRWRQHYHANVPSGWSNDPNGMIWYKGKGHFFFQHYPHKAQWGIMHWGHFTTEDFVKWEVLPVALVPTEEYEAVCGCCSGNAIEKDGKLYLMYTAAQPEQQRQCLAVSEDGISFSKLPENPILTAADLSEEVSNRDFRDPKIFIKDGWYYCIAGTRVIDPEHPFRIEDAAGFAGDPADPDAVRHSRVSGDLPFLTGFDA